MRLGRPGSAGHTWLVRVLVVTQPAYGHLHPLVPVCRTLVVAGHEVTVATSRSFQARVEASGLAGVAAGIDWLESDIASAFPDYAEHQARGESKAFLLSEVFAWRTARAMADDLITLAGERRIDVVIREPWEFGGAIAASKLNLPCVLHGIGTIANVEEVVSLAGARLAQHAAELGLSDDVWRFVEGRLYLDPCPPVLQSVPQGFCPGVSQPVTPEVFDASDGSIDLPAWLSQRGDRPVVYLGLGTVMNRWHGLLKRLVMDIRRLGVDLLVTTGPGVEPADLGPQPTNVHVERYLPLSAVLPHCDAVVCHGGWGTTIASLTHGLPLVIVPLGADGPRMAAKCEQAGLARTVTVDDAHRGETPAALTEVLELPRYREAALAAREQIAQMPSTTDAVDAIASAADTPDR